MKLIASTLTNISATSTGRFFLNHMTNLMKTWPAKTQKKEQDHKLPQIITERTQYSIKRNEA